MKHLEFGKTLCLLKELVKGIEAVLDGEKTLVDIDLLARCYTIIDRNKDTANKYIEYQVNYMNEQLSKKGKTPSPFDEWEDSGFYKKDGGKKYD